MYSPDSGGYSVELPPDWRTRDPKQLAQSGTGDPRLQPLELAGTLVAVPKNPAVINDGSNILVYHFDRRGTSDDHELLKQTIAGLQDGLGAEGPGVVSHLTMAGFEAESVTYRTTHGYREVDNVVVSGGIVFLVNCTAPVQYYARIKRACSHAVASFTLTD